MGREKVLVLELPRTVPRGLSAERGRASSKLQLSVVPKYPQHQATEKPDRTPECSVGPLRPLGAESELKVGCWAAPTL